MESGWTTDGDIRNGDYYYVKIRNTISLLPLPMHAQSLTFSSYCSLSKLSSDISVTLKNVSNTLLFKKPTLKNNFLILQSIHSQTKGLAPVFLSFLLSACLCLEETGISSLFIYVVMYSFIECLYQFSIQSLSFIWIHAEYPQCRLQIGKIKGAPRTQSKGHSKVSGKGSDIS